MKRFIKWCGPVLTESDRKYSGKQRNKKQWAADLAINGKSVNAVSAALRLISDL